jgi:Flp pilus assembly protein TadD
MAMHRALLLLAASVALAAEEADPARQPLELAYAALQAKRYETAVRLFRKAAELAPQRASIRKDIGYTYLKMGDSESARGEFAEAMRLSPGDLHASLEYGFLCYETGRNAEARHIFDKVRSAPDTELSETAERAFQNIDQPLAEGIDRWQKALAANPADFNAHRELATLAESREDPAVAAEHYLKAWRLRPSQRSLLVDLGRVYLAANMPEQAQAALIAAAWGGETRAAEAARGIMPPRYPYVYEFRQAIELDPDNAALRSELASLLYAMGRQAEADKETGRAPATSKVQAGETGYRTTEQIRALADKSYQAGYMRDALEYYSLLHDREPLDYRAILQLGWTNNILGRDKEAVRWFNIARSSGDARISSEAARAYFNLRPYNARFRVTAWILPSYSSRWEDMFTYGQVKVEFKPGRLPLRAYGSVRFVGDALRTSHELSPQYLSESAFIPSVGVATEYRHGVMLWAEAGMATSYLDSSRNLPRTEADLRGGAAYHRGFGTLLGANKRGIFAETNDDGVYLHRFNQDFILYSQNRLGITLPARPALGGLQMQFFLSTNFSSDLRREYWANTAEAGPGLRFRWNWMPASWVYSVSFLRGVYTVTEGNPRDRMYSDLRVSYWYAFRR